VLRPDPAKLISQRLICRQPDPSIAAFRRIETAANVRASKIRNRSAGPRKQAQSRQTRDRLE
jgi:hypothetical protein